MDQILLILNKFFIFLKFITIFTFIIYNYSFAADKIILDQKTKNGSNEINLCGGNKLDCVRFKFLSNRRHENDVSKESILNNKNKSNDKYSQKNKDQNSFFILYI